MSPSDIMEQHSTCWELWKSNWTPLEHPFLLKVKAMILLMSLLDNYKFLVIFLRFLESIDFENLAWEVITTMLNVELMKKSKFGSFKLFIEFALML